jgi:hypothetical protein
MQCGSHWIGRSTGIVLAGRRQLEGRKQLAKL